MDHFSKPENENGIHNDIQEERPSHGTDNLEQKL